MCLDVPLFCGSLRLGCPTCNTSRSHCAYISGCCIVSLICGWLFDVVVKLQPNVCNVLFFGDAVPSGNGSICTGWVRPRAFFHGSVCHSKVGGGAGGLFHLLCARTELVEGSHSCVVTCVRACIPTKIWALLVDFTVYRGQGAFGILLVEPCCFLGRDNSSMLPTCIIPCLRGVHPQLLSCCIQNCSVATI